MEVKKSKMNKEVERKFIIESIPKDLDKFKHYNILQGYITSSESSDVRVRREGGTYLITVKRGSGIERNETEVKLSEEQFNELWNAVENKIEKTRYEIPIDRFTSYIDIYHDKLEGLVVGEVEFISLQEARSFKAPEWFGADVTDIEYYKNKNLGKLSDLNAQRLLRGIIETPLYSLNLGIEQILKEIERLSNNSTAPIVVEIAGGSASGKSSAVAGKIATALGDKVIKLSMDDYYLGQSYINRKKDEGIKINWDQPEAIDIKSLERDISLLKEGKPISKPVYDFKSGETVSHENIDPAGKKVILLEGLFSLYNGLSGIGNLKVFIDVALHDRIIRRIIRDADRASWRFSEMLHYMLTVVEPMYNKYIEPQKYNADMVISNPYVPMIEAAKIKTEEKQIKYRLGENVLTVADKLERLGADRLGDSEQYDYYFTRPDSNLKKSDEIVKVRKENGAILFEYKGPKQQSGSRKKMVFEIDEDTLALMLSYYQLSLTIKKHRTIYRFLGATLSLDKDVTVQNGIREGPKNLGNFVEVRENTETETLSKLEDMLGLKDNFSEVYSRME